MKKSLILTLFTHLEQRSEFKVFLFSAFLLFLHDSLDDCVTASVCHVVLFLCRVSRRFFVVFNLSVTLNCSFGLSDLLGLCDT